METSGHRHIGLLLKSDRSKCPTCPPQPNDATVTHPRTSGSGRYIRNTYTLGHVVCLIAANAPSQTTSYNCITLLLSVLIY